MRNFFVIGDQASKSLSPLIFNHWFKKYNIQAKYSFLEVTKKNFDSEIVKKLNNKHTHGFNVTIPFKKDIIKHLDNKNVHAQKIGAVNCVTVDKKTKYDANVERTCSTQFYKLELDQWEFYNLESDVWSTAIISNCSSFSMASFLSIPSSIRLHVVFDLFRQEIPRIALLSVEISRLVKFFNNVVIPHFVTKRSSVGGSLKPHRKLADWVA